MFAVRWSPRRVPGDSTIGIVYSVAGALAILCIAKSAMGETHMLKLLQGDVLTVAPRETLQMLGIFAVIASVHALFGKEFLLVSFDRDAASTMGYHAVRWDFLLYLTIGIVISFSIRATGVLMATTMLIIPAVTALLLAQRMRQVWPLALVLGVVPVVLGLHLSFLLDLPASAIIVALSFAILLPVLAFSARRH
jgi:ABC-type Mn2+/Zn2+ transport system permease subunit